jgi:hypothetical protein
VISNTVANAGKVRINPFGLHLERHMLHSMSTTLQSAPDRSAADVNEEIRALWLRSGGILNSEQRLTYQQLVAEWAAASPHPGRDA